MERDRDVVYINGSAYKITDVKGDEWKASYPVIYTDAKEKDGVEEKFRLRYVRGDDEFIKSVAFDYKITGRKVILNKHVGLTIRAKIWVPSDSDDKNLSFVHDTTFSGVLHLSHLGDTF